MSKWIPIVLLAALVGGQLAIIATGIYTSQPTEEFVSVTRPPDGLGGALMFEDVNSYITTDVKTWNPDAQLVSGQVQIDWPDDFVPSAAGELPNGGWILLAYVADLDLLTLRIDRGSGVIVQSEITELSDEEAQAYLSHVVDFSKATVSSGDAASAFEVAHGSTFRSACPVYRGQSFIAPQISTNTGQWVWAISYINRHETDPTNYMTGEVDWATANIGQVEGTDLPCDATS